MVAGLTRKEMTTEDRQPTVRDCLTVGCEEAVMDKYMEAVMVSGVLQAEVNRLEAINADLLEALKGVMPWASKAVADHPYNQIAGKRVLDAAVEVIERVEGES